LTRHNQTKLFSPRTCGVKDANLTFKPVLSPKNDQILEQRKTSPSLADPDLRRKQKFEDECTFKPNLVAR